MPPLDPDTIAGTLPDWSLTFLEADAPDLPAAWRPVVGAADPAARRDAALALWNRDLLDELPRFADLLGERLADVRAVVTYDSPALVYVVETDDGEYLSWVGFDPGSFGDPPPFWDSFPGPLRTFLREVHAGFVGDDLESFGPQRPRHIQTIAAAAGWPAGIPDFDNLSDIPSTRLVQVTSDGGLLTLCVSPDLPAGEVALVYEGDIDPQGFGEALDDLMVGRLEA